MMGRVKPPVKAVQGKTLILGVLGALVLVVGLVFWIGMSGGSTHVPVNRPGVGFTVDDTGAAADPQDAAKATGGEPDGGR